MKDMRDVLKLGDKVVNKGVRWGVPPGEVWTVREFDNFGDAWVETDSFKRAGTDKYESCCISLDGSWAKGSWEKIGPKFSHKPVGSWIPPRKMKVGDKLKLVSDRPDHLWIESPVGTVFEVVGDGWAFHPKNRYGKGCNLCVHSGCGFYSYSGLTPCCAYRVIN